VNEIERVLRRNPAHTETALNLANSYLEEKKPELAERVYREALRLDPESALLWRQLGYARYLLGDLEEAVASHRRALEIDPLDLDAPLNLAIILIAAGEFAEAKRVSERGLERDPGHAGLHNARGMALKGLGETAAAIDELRKAKAADPRFDRPYLNLARLLFERGEPQGAREVLERLLSVLPDHPAAREMLKD
jgi:tetratricopeptide (TPR) repeat protein